MYTNSRGVMALPPAGIDTLPYPNEIYSRDVVDGLPFGRIIPEGPGEPGDEVRIPAGPLVSIAARGHGKTNTLRTLIAGRATRHNAVTWLIDTYTGELVADAVRAYVATGTAPALVDWAAVDKATAIEVSVAARQLIDHRARLFSREFLMNGVDKLTPSVEHPDVSVIVEGSHLSRDSDLFRLLAEINQLGRMWGVSVAFASFSPEAVQPLITPETVVSVDRHNTPSVGVFGWANYLLEGMPRDTRGASWIGFPERRPTVQRTYLTQSQTLWRLAYDGVEVASLDETTAAVLGTNYTARWKRKQITEFLDDLRK